MRIFIWTPASLYFLVMAAYPLGMSLSNSASQTAANDAAKTAAQTRAWRQTHEAAVMDELVALLAIPNVASDTPNIQRNAEKLTAMLHARGFSTQPLPEAGRGPVIFARLDTPGAKRTVIFYMH